MRRTLILDPCLCGSELNFDSCCGPSVVHREPASSAEALMRSRYTAFARGDRDYLLYSWDPETCPDSLSLGKARKWTGLHILSTEGGRATDVSGTVRFVACFVDPSGPGQLEELSWFRRHEGRWVYHSGVHKPR